MIRSLLLGLLLLPLIARADGNEIILYDGYGSSERFVVEGRVIEAEDLSQAKPGDSWWRNLWRNLRLLRNEEREHFPLTVTVAGLSLPVTSDEEGHFRVEATATPPLAPGWQAVTAQGKKARGEGRLLIVPPTNTLGIVSDIDDTVQVSEVPETKRLLNNTLLKNPQQRQAFPGTADFFKRLLAGNAEPEAAPMFYVSGTPRQLAGNVEAFLAGNGFPRGVLVTKRIGGDNGDPLRDHKQYKTARIEAILAALPWVNFVLVGDNGEVDPETYCALREKYPQRISAIYIRNVDPAKARTVCPAQADLAAAISVP